MSLSDSDLATQALGVLELLETRTATTCTGCYAVDRANVRHLWDQTITASETCFVDLELLTPAAAQAAVACFGTGGSYHRDNLGIFASGAHLDWFAFAFQRAFGAGWMAEHQAFVAAVGPDPLLALSQAEFDLLSAWFLRGTPDVEFALPHGQAVGTCETFVDASVVALVGEGEISGWGARNAQAALFMHGCAGASDPSTCLQVYTDAASTTFGASWAFPAQTTTRVLFEVPYNTSYTTRSSADGRFVGHGGGSPGSGATIIDLQREVAVGASAQYDPGFFPDNSGFMFQGSGTSACASSVLTLGNPTSLTLFEPGCTAPTGIGFQQQLGSSLDADDHWAIDSLSTRDTGQGSMDPQVIEQAGATVTLNRLLTTPSGFINAGSFVVSVPNESDAAVSPTMRLLVTRLGDGSGRPIGYALRRVDITRGGGGTVTAIDLPVVARYCHPGGTATASYDDRFLVMHHRATVADAVDLGFTGPGDPNFIGYAGTSNIYLVDLITGRRSRISHMAPGQRAVYPHFRSDGWVHYVVRTGALPEYIVATDATIWLR